MDTEEIMATLYAKANDGTGSDRLNKMFDKTIEFSLRDGENKTNLKTAFVTLYEEWATANNAWEDAQTSTIQALRLKYPDMSAIEQLQDEYMTWYDEHADTSVDEIDAAFEDMMSILKPADLKTIEAEFNQVEA
ncbi:hypothetical protein EQG49_01105 [Periweissella cryptocerci]|uniref:Uncharacterized protein n=1 Tax=Periweissella cryptocerci TaxID=2506420 RepID=A0A4P6YR85_9LACO|nr:hypothetical protein [Periweissella cryptocerci]QBO35149.1 hypothetical protein EQG49_01105 [Periweissella cryptocerci]